MVTKFLLHGGILSRDDPRNNSYFREITKDLSDGDTVLFIGFARSSEERQHIYERDAALIKAQADKNISVVNATHDGFIEQLKHCQAIHITGGDCEQLLSDVNRYPEFAGAIKGKVIGGSSAGAQLFSTYYFGCTKKNIYKGLGILPICLLVHYGNPEYNATDEALDMLRPYATNLELLAVEECAWVTREVK